jgi:CBS domain-containing protein
VMERLRISQLLVTNDNEVLVGALTTLDLMRAKVI